MCADSAQCNDGVCEPTGFCSFSDPDCSTGQRYGTASGELSDLCVDASPGGEPAACDPGQPFGSPVPVAGLASNTEDASLRLSPDEKTAYFFSARGGMKQLFTASRSSVSATFVDIKLLNGVNTTADLYNPSITFDGLTLFFASYRDNSNDIFKATRTSISADFSAGIRALNINTSDSEVQPYVTRDAMEIYFVRTASDGIDTVFRATGDAAATTGFMNAASVAELNNANDNADPVPSKDGLTLYWATNRPGGKGDLDVWEAHRASTMEPFGAFAPVTSVNTAALDAPSDVSKDGCRLYLTSTVSGPPKIYVASRPAMAAKTR